MEKRFVVYKITNTVNDKVYIGCTSRRFEQRKKEHLSSARITRSKQTIHCAMRKDGFKNFIFEVIFHALTHEDMLYMEIQFIEEHGSFKFGYNSTIGGEGTIGYIPTEEAKKNMSNSAIKYPVSQYNLLTGELMASYASAKHAGGSHWSWSLTNMEMLCG